MNNLKSKSNDFLKSHDMFGHTVQINFNRQGDTHTTSTGGFFSLLIKVAMFIYVFLNLKKLVLSEADDLSSESFLVADEIDGDASVVYNET